MAVTKDEILDAISKMSVMEVVELISDMEKKFNVTAAAPVAAAAAGGAAAAAPAAEAQTEFTVTMTEFGANKVGVIKVIREITGLGLKEAKDLVEGAPSTVKEGIPKADAETIKKKLEDDGAKAAICAFDFEVDSDRSPARRALSDGVASTPLIRRASAWKF